MTWLDSKNAKSEEIANELHPIYKYANCVDCPSDWFFPPDKRGGRHNARPGSDLFNAFSTCNECFDFAKKYGCVGVWGGRLFTHRKISKVKIER